MIQQAQEGKVYPMSTETCMDCKGYKQATYRTGSFLCTRCFDKLMDRLNRRTIK